MAQDGSSITGPDHLRIDARSIASAAAAVVDGEGLANRSVPDVGALSRVARSQSHATASAKGSWIARHPVAAGALIGLGGGFLIGAMLGAEDLDASFVGLVWGGGGAAVGALVGKASAKP